MADDETTTAVQTESTNLAMVMETNLGRRTPPTTGWYNLDPNSYGEFGPQYKKTPRDPITANLQLRKGMLTDEDSGLGLEFDVTKEMVDRFGEAIFRSVAKHSGGTGVSQFRPTSVTALHYVVGASGNVPDRTLVIARGSDIDGNNGLKMLTAATDQTLVAPGLAVEAAPPSNFTVEIAGYRGAAGTLRLDTDGNLISVAGVDFTTLGLNPFQWLVLGGEEDANRFDTDVFNGSARIAVDGVAAAKITFDRRSWVVDEHASLDIDTVVLNLNTIVQAVASGLGGNAVTIAAVADGAPYSVSEAGSAVTIHFTPGVTTVAQVESAIGASATVLEVLRIGTAARVLTLDDVFAATALSGGTDGIDLGAGKEIDLYYTKWLRNVSMRHADYRKPSIAFEIEYPELSPSGGPMYQYLLGNMVNEWKWNIPLTNKATCNVSFVGTRSLALTETRKTGPSAAIDPIANEGVSTMTDLQRLRVDDVDETGISTDFSSITITVNNNVSPQKQLGKRGARIMNQGQHTQKFEGDAIFSSSPIIDAIRDNRTCTADVLMRNADFGALIDLQAMTLDSGPMKMERNKAVMVSSQGTGFQHDKSGSTASLSVFAYLPPTREEDE